MSIIEKNYWEKYYQDHRINETPSPFAKFCRPFLDSASKVLELGCGNGRDAIFLSKNTQHYTGIDQCSNEIRYLQDFYREIANLEFYDQDMSAIKRFFDINVIYSRFTIHSVSIDQETQILQWAFKNLENYGRFFIEVRTTKDEFYGKGLKVAEHTYKTDHSRRFIDTKEFLQKCNKIGFRINYSLESQGLAIWKDEDPCVLRVILQK